MVALGGPSLLGAERLAVDRALGKPLSQALAENQNTLADIRGVIALVVGRILPPALRGTLAPTAAKIFGKVDALLYKMPRREAPAPHPVRTPAADKDIRPVVHTLRLVVQGAGADQARSFSELLSGKINAQFATTAPAG
jgi:hypothetical protein